MYGHDTDRTGILKDTVNKKCDVCGNETSIAQVKSRILPDLPYQTCSHCMMQQAEPFCAFEYLIKSKVRPQDITTVNSWYAGQYISYGRWFFLQQTAN